MRTGWRERHRAQQRQAREEWQVLRSAADRWLGQALLPRPGRSTEPEQMDGPGFDDPALAAAVLDDLARVNRLTRTHEPVLQALQAQWQALPPPAPGAPPLRVLDIGCGQGDGLRAIWRMAWAQRRPVALMGLDLSPAAVAEARRHTPSAMRIRYMAGNVFELAPPPGEGFDHIVCTQMAHHLDDAHIVRLLHWMDRHARLGWVLTDLRRHALPYWGFRWLARAMRWHPVVREDGTRSIARALTPEEWVAMLARAGVAGEVRTHLPFRLSVRSVRAEPPGPAP